MKYMDGSEKFPEIKLINFYSQLQHKFRTFQGDTGEKEGFQKLNAALTSASSIVLAEVSNPSELLSPYIQNRKTCTYLGVYYKN